MDAAGAWFRGPDVRDLVVQVEQPDDRRADGCARVVWRHLAGQPRQRQRLLAVLAAEDAADRRRQEGLDALQQQILAPLAQVERTTEVERLVALDEAGDLATHDSAELLVG